MFRRFVSIAALAALSAMPTLALVAPSPAIAAKPCRSASGKFVKCSDASSMSSKSGSASAMATPMASKMSKRCRGASGKFVKCSSSMATPK